jgi:hypothetical protein
MFVHASIPTSRCARAYEMGGDETRVQLAQNYYIMKEEAKSLSKLVEKQLQEYNRKILHNSAVLMDDWWSCFWCTVGFSALCYLGCAGLCVLWPPFCMYLLYCGQYGCDVAVYLTCMYLGYCP